MIKYSFFGHSISCGTSMEEDGNLALHTNDIEENILENRVAFAKKINVPLPQWVLANQTHSTNIVQVTQSDAGKGSSSLHTAIENCDALYTKEENLLIGVFSADCLPILLYEKEKHIVAAIHSGWKGTVQEMLTKTIDFLIQKEQINIQQLQIIFGPSIHQSHFQAKNDILSKLSNLPFPCNSFIQMVNEEEAYVDLIGINYQMLLSLGIQKKQIYIDSTNTYEKGFSYRKNHTKKRHLTYIIQTN